MTVGGGRSVGGLYRFQHQGWPIDPVGEFASGWELSVDRPDEGHPVRGDEIKFFHGCAKVRVATGECCDVGVGCLDGIGAVGECGLFQDPGDRPCVIGSGNGKADDWEKFQNSTLKIQGR